MSSQPLLLNRQLGFIGMHHAAKAAAVRFHQGAQQISTSVRICGFCIFLPQQTSRHRLSQTSRWPRQPASGRESCTWARRDALSCSQLPHPIVPYCGYSAIFNLPSQLISTQELLQSSPPGAGVVSVGWSSFACSLHWLAAGSPIAARSSAGREGEWKGSHSLAAGHVGSFGCGTVRHGMVGQVYMYSLPLCLELLQCRWCRAWKTTPAWALGNLNASPGFTLSLWQLLSPGS